jgi:WD40 repeat protein
VRATANSGVWLATAHEDGVIRVWDTEDSLLLEISGSRSDALAVAVAPDGRLAVGRANRTVEIWPAAGTIDTLVGRARSRVLRTLTDAERRSARLPGE